MVKNDDKYTDPELRSEIKDTVQAGDKGGKPGQWSARKAQMMASEYKKAMNERGEEPYTTDKSEQSESQKHLNEWTKEDWQTSDGQGKAKQDDGTEKRYLPKKAWENMTEEEKEETNAKKVEGSAKGEQYVPNTDASKKARKDTQGDDEDVYVVGNDPHEKSVDGDDETNETSSMRGTKHKRSEKDKICDADESKGKGSGDQKDDETSHSQPAAKKAKGNGGEERITQAKSKQSTSESSNVNQSEAGDKKGNNEHGQPGSSTRLPEEGQKVFWRSTPGWCEGTVVEVAHSEKEVDGRHVKASKEDPRIVLKSAKSGKTAVHKPEAVYF